MTTPIEFETLPAQAVPVHLDLSIRQPPSGEDQDPGDESMRLRWSFRTGPTFVRVFSGVLGLEWLWRTDAPEDGDPGDEAGRWVLVDKESGEDATIDERKMVRGYYVDRLGNEVTRAGEVIGDAPRGMFRVLGAWADSI